ncbi:unnamed protein product [Prunus armeniaca]|uniref:Uncharacterized protein n=1 Tax=Prunus armeniaca TaxID=36596 RepID=A0A6J5UMM9_PRUAR|nr:unnamed protein product [Prunus armeniaca]
MERVYATPGSNIFIWLEVLRVDEKRKASARLNKLGPHLYNDHKNQIASQQQQLHHYVGYDIWEDIRLI